MTYVIFHGHPGLLEALDWHCAFLAARKQRSIDDAVSPSVRESVHNEIPMHTLHAVQWGGSSRRARSRQRGKASVCIIRVFILQQQKQQQLLLLLLLLLHLPCPINSEVSQTDMQFGIHKRYLLKHFIKCIIAIRL